MARLGIVGFTNSGKTTLFNALTGLEAATATHPYNTTEPNMGVARIPDPKLEAAALVEKSVKVVPATLELLDLPALSPPGREGGGLGGRFLGQLREMDALVVVLRAFSNPSVTSEDTGIDPMTQAEELLLELALADHEVLARRADRLNREANSDPSKRGAANVINEAVEVLAGGASLRTREWSEEALAAFRDSSPLTLKPAVWVVNLDEGTEDTSEVVERLQRLVPPGDPVVAVSARLEEEGAKLSADERAELFEGLGLGEGALSLMVRAAYQGLGLLSFYTVGPKESRAWTVRAGAAAPEAAGKIHSDLERGFIRAEVSTIDQVIEAGGWDQAKRLGIVRVEGKSYVIKPDDVLVIRFSV
jgi:GTP-binding protein YchF